MTDRIAIVIGGVVITALIYDLSFQSGEITFFLFKNILDLIEWIAFWR